MSDKRHPAGEQRESGSLTHGGAGESKGAVVISGSGVPDGYEPPSGALTQPSADDAATPASGDGDGDGDG